MYVLTVLSGPDAGRIERFASLPVPIGRSAEGGLVLSDRLAGPLHGQLDGDGVDLWYEDLGSRHGTVVEDERGAATLHASNGVTRCRLAAAARLVIGESMVLVQDLGFGEEPPTRLLLAGPHGDGNDEESEQPTVRLTGFEPRFFALFRLAQELWHAGSVGAALQLGAEAAMGAFAPVRGVEIRSFGAGDEAAERETRWGPGTPAEVIAQSARLVERLGDAEVAPLPRCEPGDWAIHGVALRGRGRAAGALVVVLTPGSTLQGGDIEVLEAMADLVAGALERLRLEAEVHAMFDGIVEMCVAAVDARDPATAGHSARVAELALALHDAWAAQQAPADVAERRETLRYAALLHDIGKIGVREAVLMKSTRLEASAHAALSNRLEAARCAVQAGRPLQGELACEDAAQDVATLDALELAVDAAMDGRVQPASVRGWFPRASRTLFVDSKGRTCALLSAREAEALLVERGTLTTGEWREMQAHVEHTRRLLERIPWPQTLRGVPGVAALHHEKLDGSGYPLGVGAEELPVEARMLSIADIFDAVSGADRIYRPALPPSEACAVLLREAREGALDGGLVDLFVRDVLASESRRADRKTG